MPSGTVLARLVLAAVLPNVPLLLLRSSLHLKSAWLNLDFFLLALLACAFSVRLASALFVLTYALECVRLLDALYYFSRSDPLFAVRFLGEVHAALVAEWAAGFAAVTGLSLWLWRRVLPRARGWPLMRAALPVALVVLLLAVTDQVRGYTLVGDQRHARGGYRAVDEVLLRVPLSGARAAPVAPVVATEDSASAPLWDVAGIAGRRNNVLLVNVESMGRLLDSKGAEKEFALFTTPEVQQRYIVHTGAVPFTGSTVSGEMRELCRLRTGMHITPATLVGQPPCLPAQYRAAGYQAVAIHGFRSTMFQRSRWYPLLGFNQTRFLSDLSDLPVCEGAFYGVCDAEVAQALQQQLEAHADGTAPLFLYWMTLNSHLPADEAHAPPGECPVAADRHVCAQLAYVHAALAAVQRIALDPKIGRTAMVIVGDHAPPFLLPEERGRFDPRMVPFVYLEPR